MKKDKLVKLDPTQVINGVNMFGELYSFLVELQAKQYKKSVDSLMKASKELQPNKKQTSYAKSRRKELKQFSIEKQKELAKWKKNNV